ncbi:hypothetical protein CFter6_1606 [Collimonas fungivorans]|uniref:Uncharacterized protein n=1 Tax=Collimonas fungivorans TaxID=158899 RepID=A0A127P973_9BURK|nr:hypothetical protein CFter6_1606 [Collimonas fungivorans]
MGFRSKQIEEAHKQQRQAPPCLAFLQLYIAGDNRHGIQPLNGRMK